MKVFVVLAKEEVDVTGEVMATSFVAGVSSTREGADKIVKDLVDRRVRKSWDIDVEEMEVS